MGRFRKQAKERVLLCRKQVQRNKNWVRKVFQGHIAKFPESNDLKHNPLVVPSLRQILKRKISSNPTWEKDFITKVSDTKLTTIKRF